MARTHKCVVRGEEVSNPGSFSDVQRGRIDKETFIPYDGCNTDVGVVCESCIPIYDEAFRLHEFGDLSPKQLRKAIKRTLKDSSFVTEFLRERNRAKIAEIVEGLEFPMSKADILQIEDLLTEDYDAAKYPVVGLHQGLMDRCGIEGLSSNSARACLKETERTSKFLEAIFAKLAQLEQERDSIEVIDAGCGPIPILGLIAALKSAKTKVTCLETNISSAMIATDIIEFLGLQDRVQVVHTDATKYQHDQPIDLLISETMYTGLTCEPLIQILQNLAPQVKEDGVVIPEWVTVEAGIISHSKYKEEEENMLIIPNPTGGIKVLEPFFEADPREVVRFTRDQLHDTIQFSLPLTDLPDDRYAVTIGSRVGLSEGIVLEGLESNITAPVHIPSTFEKKPNEQPVSVHISYTPGTSRKKIQAQTSYL